MEEKFLGKQRTLHPVQVVGYEGCSASILWIVVLIMLYFVPCDSPVFCPDGKLENSLAALEDLWANKALLAQSLAILIIIPFSSISGVFTTKLGSAS
jgi:hypothetical protein